MKRLYKLVLLPVLTMSLSACDLFGGLTGGSNYEGYEDYFEKELNYQKYTDMASFNQAVDSGCYFWSCNDTTNYTTYYTGKSVNISIYKDRKDVYVRFMDATYARVYEKDGAILFATDEVKLTEDGQITYYYGVDQTKTYLEVAKDNDGYLVVAYGKYAFYVTNDLQKVYVNENNTNVFQGYENTRTIASSELLTNTLAALGADQRVQLPSPGENIEIWYGMDYYKEEKSHGTAYIANVHPKDYVEVLKANGFTVNRSFEDPYYAFYGENGGCWCCFDAQEEMKLVISLTNYLYVNNSGKSYGPFYNTEIWFYRMRKGYFGEKQLTSNEDWTDAEKAKMDEWYDGSIDGSAVPFIKLSDEYRVPTVMSSAHEGILDGTLAYHHKCYNIVDESPYYLLDGYDAILEANGFHLYQPAYDLSDLDQKAAFARTEECKYVNCYINQEKNMAIKYYFDVSNGNTIRVFKLSEMKSLLTDAE